MRHPAASLTGKAAILAAVFSAAKMAAFPVSNGRDAHSPSNGRDATPARASPRRLAALGGYVRPVSSPPARGICRPGGDIKEMRHPAASLTGKVGILPAVFSAAGTAAIPVNNGRDARSPSVVTNWESRHLAGGMREEGCLLAEYASSAGCYCNCHDRRKML